VRQRAGPLSLKWRSENKPAPFRRANGLHENHKELIGSGRISGVLKFVLVEGDNLLAFTFDHIPRSRAFRRDRFLGDLDHRTALRTLHKKHVSPPAAFAAKKNEKPFADEESSGGAFKNISSRWRND
jgi:hypothetical protein